ncbi:MAG: hypothetical protein AAF603_08985 [Pseudomonadota bacterium]
MVDQNHTPLPQNGPGGSVSSDLTIEAVRPVVVERFSRDERTAMGRIGHVIGKVADEVMTATGLALILFPFLALAALTLDLAFTGFDGWGEAAAIAPSLWMSHGEFLLITSVFAIIMMTRRHGAQIVSRGQAMAWLVVMGLTAMMLLYLTPRLAPGDLPRGNFMMALSLSWVLGQQVAIQLYDITRGGRWWRSPFIACVFGFAVQVGLFFPLAYGGTGVPWVSWMAVDFLLKVGLSLSFLPLYWLMRRRVRPQRGLGGGV